MKYQIVTGRNVDDLEAKVNRAIASGYVPQGGVLIVGMTYAQAVVTRPKQSK